MIRTSILIIITFLSGCTLSEPAYFKSYFNSPPKISILIMNEDQDVQTYSLNIQGEYEYDKWVDRKPGVKPLNIQFSSNEYNEAINLVDKVLQNNYYSEKNGAGNSDLTRYTIRLGEYWSSIVLNIIVLSTEETPIELQHLMIYLKRLKQPNKPLNVNGQPQAAAH